MVGDKAKPHNLPPIKIRRKQMVTIPVTKLQPPQWRRNKIGECKVCVHLRIAWDHQPCIHCTNADHLLNAGDSYPGYNKYNYFEVDPKYSVDIELENLRAEMESEIVRLANENKALRKIISRSVTIHKPGGYRGHK